MFLHCTIPVFEPGYCSWLSGESKDCSRHLDRIAERNTC